MSQILSESTYFGFAVSLVLFLIGCFLQYKTKFVLLNPLIFATAGTIVILLLTGVPYEKYAEGTHLLSYFMTPVTVCLAVPLYEQVSLLKHSWRAVLAGILAGVVIGMGSILLMSLSMGLEKSLFVTLLPKGITTAIAMGLSEKLGGLPAATATGVMITGIFGYATAVGVLKLFRITEPVARGVAIGTSCHVIGTTRAMEIGQVEGAMSSLSLAVAGIVTAAAAPFFAGFYGA